MQKSVKKNKQKKSKKMIEFKKEKYQKKIDNEQES